MGGVLSWGSAGGDTLWRRRLAVQPIRLSQAVLAAGIAELEEKTGDGLRGNDTSLPRRVLLPGWFQVMDATETHVWGVWKDELDVNCVVGRRLVLAEG